MISTSLADPITYALYAVPTGVQVWPAVFAVSGLPSVWVRTRRVLAVSVPVSVVALSALFAALAVRLALLAVFSLVIQRAVTASFCRYGGVICRRSPTDTAPTWGFPTAGDARSGRIICSRLYAGSPGVPFAMPVGCTVGYSG